MSTEADAYNARNPITAAEQTAASKLIQIHLGLTIDGKFGPDTRRALMQWANHAVPSTTAPLDFTIDGVGLFRSPVETIRIDKTWHGGLFAKNKPEAIVWHYTTTGPGTARTMAHNRKDPFRKGVDRAASWHLTIDTDGSVVQMMPLICKAWHAGSNTAKKIPGLGWANDVSIGIELVSQNGVGYTTAQVEAAKKVARALVQTYDIQRQYALLAHGDIDPDRRSDPGPEWMKRHGPQVVEHAYA